MRRHFVLGACFLVSLAACGGNNPTELFEDAGDLPDTGAGNQDAADAQSDVDGGLTGGPRASLASDTLDFGPSECGSVSAGTEAFEITNVGGEPLTWSASLDADTYFLMAGAAKGTIAPGDKGSILIAAKPVPASATAAAVMLGKLTITTNDPANLKIEVPVKTTATGATIEVTPSVAGFGLIPVDTQATDIVVNVKNTGNLPVDVTLGTPSDSQFSLVWTGGNVVKVAPGGQVPGLKARFKPNVMTDTTTKAQITVSGPVCGTSATEIVMKGQGSVGAISITPSLIDFGKTDCGSTSALPVAQRTVTITNSGNAAFTWSAALVQGASSPYTLTTTNTTIAPTKTGTIVVAPKAVPATSSTAADAFGDTLRITTNIPGDTPHDVDVQQTANGVVLTTNPTTVGFGNVALPKSSTLPFTITNTGNVAAPGITATVTGDNPAAFSAKTTTFGTLAAGATSSSDDVTFTPGSTATHNARIDLGVTGSPPMCGPLPSVTLTGTGTNGDLRVSTSAIAMGTSVDNTQSPAMGYTECGKAAPSRSFVVSNIGNGAFTFNATLRKGTAYALSGDDNVTVNPGKTATVTITPNAIPDTSAVTPNLYGDVIDIVPVDIYGDPGNHTVTLYMTAKGAILAAVSDVNVGTTTVGTPISTTFTVINNGNAPVDVGFAMPGITNFSVGSGTKSIAGGGGSAAFDAYFTPSSDGFQSAGVDWSVPGTATLCAPVPASFNLTGTANLPP